MTDAVMTPLRQQLADALRALGRDVATRDARAALRELGHTGLGRRDVQYHLRALVVAGLLEPYDIPRGPGTAGGRRYRVIGGGVR